MAESRDKSQPESDSKRLPTHADFSNVTNRVNKRKEGVSTADFAIFKEEIKELISSMMSTHLQEFKKHSDKLNEIQQININIEKSVAFLSDQHEELKKKINSLENQISENQKYVTILENRIEDLVKESRKTNFEIKNVPKKTNESKEDLISMVVHLSNEIGCSLNKDCIKDIYRTRGKKVGTNTSIVIETSSTLLKNNILKSCKVFNIKHKTKLCAKHLGFHTSEDTPIFVSEHLTAKASRLHFLARELVKAKSFKFCWTAYGKVYLRRDENSPIILIHSETQITNLAKDK